MFAPLDARSAEWQLLYTKYVFGIDRTRCKADSTISTRNGSCTSMRCDAVGAFAIGHRPWQHPPAIGGRKTRVNFLNGLPMTRDASFKRVLFSRKNLFIQ